MEEEIFKTIKSNPEYRVSNKGKVVNKDGKELRYYKNNSGYLYVSLERPHKRMSVHHLVASEFIDNTNNYKCINHKDHNKENNNVDNLEWCDYSYNNSYSAYLRNKPIIQLDMNNKTIQQFSSIKEASEKLLLDKSTIVKVLKGKRNHTGGYKFIYA